jgi:hypothetical protein
MYGGDRERFAMIGSFTVLPAILSRLGDKVCRCNAGSASTRSSAVDATVAITGWRRTGLRIAA